MTKQADIYAGKSLRRIRKFKGLTQKQLGESIGVTFQQIQKYEKGTNRISVSTLSEICKVLEINPLVFFTNED